MNPFAKPMHNEYLELTKVTMVGFIGRVAGITLQDISLYASIGVSVVTFLYVSVKLWVLVKSLRRK